MKKKLAKISRIEGYWRRNLELGETKIFEHERNNVGKIVVTSGGDF